MCWVALKLRLSLNVDPGYAAEWRPAYRCAVPLWQQEPARAIGGRTCSPVAARQSADGACFGLELAHKAGAPNGRLAAVRSSAGRMAEIGNTALRLFHPRIDLHGLLTKHRLRQAWYLPILATAMVIMFVRILVMARLLDVSAFGLYSAVLLVSSMSNMLASFGLYPSLQRDLPLLIYRQKERAAAIATTQALLGASAVAALGWLLSLLGLQVAGLQSSWLAVAVLHGLSQQTFLVVTTDSRSRANTLLFARENLWRAVITLAAIVPVAFFSRSALLTILAEAAVTLAVSTVILGYVHAHARLSFATLARLAIARLPRLDRSALLSLLLVSIGAFISINIDRWLASDLLVPADFGQYAFAWTLMIIALYLQALVNAAAFPMIARRQAALGRPGAFRITAVLSGVIIVGMAVFVVPGLFIAEKAIGVLFPAYGGAVVLLPFLALAAGMRLADFWSSFLIIAGLEKVSLLLNALSTAVGVAVWYLWVVAFSDRALMGIDFARLALLVSVLNYIAAFAASWHAVRPRNGVLVARGESK